MVWLYERGLEDLHIETSFDKSTKEFVLALHRGLRNEIIERFRDAGAFGRRLETLERELADARWIPAGPPIFLQDVWKVG